MRKTKIICTIGPSSDNEDVLEKMILAGMNVARLNMSHGDRESHLQKINLIRKLREKLKKPVAIMFDTKGPEIRTGTLKNKTVNLIQGQQFILTTRELEGDENCATVYYDNIIDDIEVGNKITIDDGILEMYVKKVEDDNIYCEVLNGGLLGERKGVNLPGSDVSIPSVTEKDIDDILFAIKEDIDYVAASFIRQAADVLKIKEILKINRGENIKVISKIESRQGIKNFDEILDVSDGIMIARGDLGVEIPPEEVPIIQKELAKKCNFASKPVITATQMLDSMIRNPRPTRAEASDVANSILDGSDAIMLSGESASGKYPLESLKMMDKIAVKTEETLDYSTNIIKKILKDKDAITESVSIACCALAKDLPAKAIITPTHSGTTTRKVSSCKPQCDIVATTTDPMVYRQLSMVWGVTPLLSQKTNSTDDMIDQSIKLALCAGIIYKGDTVVITAGVPVGVSGTTNLIKVHVVENIKMF